MSAVNSKTITVCHAKDGEMGVDFLTVQLTKQEALAETGYVFALFSGSPTKFHQTWFSPQDQCRCAGVSEEKIRSLNL